MKVSKRKPKPTQKILDMEAELLTKARQERMEEVRGNIDFFDNLCSGEENQQDGRPSEG